MAKFNVLQKIRRAQIAESKRAIHGDPLTKKLKIRPQPHSVSGKRKRKLLKNWRREQKEAVDKGLVTMQDVEMTFAQGEGTSKDVKRTPAKFNKKGLKLKQLKRKGKSKTKPKPAAEISVDAMAE
ncbi:hypothetical protein POPTR_019G049300v4 [Populus trichocarpa]|uniref:Uncharacterized protein n=1 Tax=Populus trichocarpa TaxID=3694 RepID=B9IPJ0_POPTR|nr:uncharacterized protein LOC7453577 [Populus trichocarpa]PNS90540.1 hypothetical protein POPTR_019G049300v4 [Populus trichocarpa]|eukprot:XP_024446845.1 uncharacterized protein LOC112325209 [Populus trichocarpa]